MTWERGRAAGQRSLNFPLLLLAALAGLFSMYGLGPHGEDHSSGHLPPVVALAAPETHGQHDAVATKTDPTYEHDRTMWNDAVLDEDGGPGLGDCLALLGWVLAVVIGAVLAKRRTRPLFIPRRVRGAPGLCGRPPDPPCLYRLSILRC